MLKSYYSISVWQFIEIYLIYALASIFLFYLTALPSISSLILAAFSAGYYLAIGIVMVITGFVRSQKRKLRIRCSIILLMIMIVIQCIALLSNISGGSSFGYYASCSPYQNFIQRILVWLPENASCTAANQPWISWQFLFCFLCLYCIVGLIFWLRAVFSPRMA